MKEESLNSKNLANCKFLLQAMQFVVHTKAINHNFAVITPNFIQKARLKML